MTTTEKLNAVLAKLRASDTPKDKALIVAIEGLIELSTPPQVEASDDSHNAWEQDARMARETLNSMLKKLEESL